MRRLVLVLFGVVWMNSAARAEPAVFQAGFGEADVTPPLTDRPVFLAGFGNNRKATGVHDSLYARTVVLDHGDKKIALVSIDAVGLFYPQVQAIRARLKEFSYVLVSSTHNHAGPDTLGLWGGSRLTSGVDPAYLKLLEDGVIRAVRAADADRKPVSARIGQSRAPELLHDGREPYVKHDELTVLAFDESRVGRRAGVVLAWNCHPETLSSKNTHISADFVGYTVAALRRKHGCPVVYLTGTVGGLMTSLNVEVRDATGEVLKDGSFEKTARYGELVAEAANRALQEAVPLALTPLVARSKVLYLRIDNPAFRLARQLGTVKRDAFLLVDGDPPIAAPPNEWEKPLFLQTEVACLRLGDLEMAAIPGEIYPELVLGKVQCPTEPGADFPAAPVEPAIYAQLCRRHKVLIGLANDEIGYIIPKRQWDEKPPFCYGRKKSQYGEINSLGPDTAAAICEAFRAITH